VSIGAAAAPTPWLGDQAFAISRGNGIKVAPFMPSATLGPSGRRHRLNLVLAVQRPSSLPLGTPWPDARSLGAASLPLSQRFLVSSQGL